MQSERERIGFTCAYTPLQLIDAAGFAPVRLLPLTDAPDQAGSILHENMCPVVKRIIDRALFGDLPDISGLVVMNSCETMRRLADAWKKVRPDDRVVLVDLPVAPGSAAVEHFSAELVRLAGMLSDWAGRPVTPDALAKSIGEYNKLAALLGKLEDMVVRGALPGGRRALQDFFNRSVSLPVDELLVEIDMVVRAEGSLKENPAGVPVYLFGNMLADPQAVEVFEKCGCLVVGDDLCSGSRQVCPIETSAGGDPFHQLAVGLLGRPACARTISGLPGAIAGQVLDGVRRTKARGVIAHVMKFCDPYLARIPGIREKLREEGVPLLVLEGDCTLRSLGQQRTRIEAFAETLQGGGS
jgi:benzoyl-CoA reductase/2-hydroxyglutaryl-CoA dehydratase subunit BcrC/BadD/HgdB